MVHEYKTRGGVGLSVLKILVLVKKKSTASITQNFSLNDLPSATPQLTLVQSFVTLTGMFTSI
jgi:hypothetical protein